MSRCWSRSTTSSGSIRRPPTRSRSPRAGSRASRSAFLLAKRPVTPSVLEQALERARPAASRGRPAEPRRDAPPAVRAARAEPLAARCCAGSSTSTLGNPLFALELGRTLVERGPPGSARTSRSRRGRGPARHARGAAARRGAQAAARRRPERRPAHVRARGDRGDRPPSRTRVDAGVLAASTATASARRTRCSPRRRAKRSRGRASGASSTSTLAGVGRRRGAARAAPRARDASVRTQELAATVAAAAAGASARGARQEAVELAEHALRLTPAGRGRAHASALLALAGYLETAGERSGVTDLLDARARLAAAGARCAPAPGCSCPRAATSRRLDDLRRHLDRALAESEGRPGAARARAGAKARYTAPPAASSGSARPRRGRWRRSPRRAACGPDVERLALDALGLGARLRGRPIDDLCERFRAASDAAVYIADSPERVAGQRLVWRGERRPGARRPLTQLPGARRRARRADRPTRCSGCTCASSSCAPASGTRPRSCSTSGPSPPTASC